MSHLSCKIIGIQWQWIAHLEDVKWPLTEVEDDSKIQIIQMGNGMGKTTTLHLMRCVFTGIKPEDYTSSDEEMDLYGAARYKGIEQHNSSKSIFQLDLKIDNEIWQIGLIMDYDRMESKFYTVTPNEGKEYGWEPKKTFQRIFRNNTDLISLLFLDAQQAGAQSKTLNAKIVNGAISEVANLSCIDTVLRSQLPGLYSKRMAESGLKGESSTKIGYVRKGIDEIEKVINEIKYGKEGIENTKKNVTKSEEDLKAVKSNIKKLESETKLKDEIETLDKEISNLSEEIKRLTNELLSLFFDPQNLPQKSWSKFVKLYGNLKDIRWPEIITKKIISRVLEDDECICGTKIEDGSDERKNLENLREKMVGAEISEEVYRVIDLFENSKESNYYMVEEKISEIKEKKDRLMTCNKDRGSLMNRLDGNVLDKIKEMEEECSKIQEELVNEKGWLEAATSTDKRKIISNPNWHMNAYNTKGQLSNSWSNYLDCQNLYALELGLEKFKTKESEYAGLDDFKLAYDKISEALEFIQEDLVNLLKNNVTEEMRKILPKLQPASGTKIADLNEGIRLLDRNGVLKTRTNTGEELSAQYSFLLALQSMKEINLPIVLDNPSKGLDGPALKEFQINIPQNFHQCLILIYPPEKVLIGRLCKDADLKCTIKREYENSDGTNAKGRMTMYEDLKIFADFHPLEEGN